MGVVSRSHIIKPRFFKLDLGASISLIIYQNFHGIYSFFYHILLHRSTVYIDSHNH